MEVAACAEGAWGNTGMLDISRRPFGEVGARSPLCCLEGLYCHHRPSCCRGALGWLPLYPGPWSASLLEVSVSSSTRVVPEIAPKRVHLLGRVPLRL